MHIPDGFLSTPVALLGWVLAIVLVGWALRQTREQLGERQAPLMGIMAAFIFAAQMLNFPVAGGTSGHMLGGALAAIVLGPWAATLIMTSVVFIQALLFQDGGLLVLGWNVLNMGIFTAFTGYFVYGWIKKMMGNRRSAALVAGFAGGWLSVMVGAVATAIELAVSGTSPLGVALPAMAGIHAIIGIGEGLITVAAIAFITSSRPDLLQLGSQPPAARSARWVWIGLVIALVVTLFSPLASPSPDGLEWVAEEKGFLDRGLDPLYKVLPDYSIPFIENESLTTILAGVVGVFIVFGVGFAVAQVRRKRQEPT
ncbi:MAG: energy-coupling factor ABC transporter permease [Anaerolineales bacterium]|nr:energy-coupling factor ABC transporter permease [Anaerolineales bacterium]